jgi:hypothetical protein
VVEFAGLHMHLDERFPLEAVPSRVRHALLGEFNGRCPSVREVDQIPDKHWLATPGVGPSVLQTIRSITNAGLEQEVHHLTSRRLSDAELLKRLERLQEDLRWLAAQLQVRIPKDPRTRLRRQGHKGPTRNEHHNVGHRDGGTGSSHNQGEQGHVA